MATSVKLSIVMPCLNEAATLAACIRQARTGALATGMEDFEIIVADNGSVDGSPDIARSEGAVVVDVPDRGYGAAIRAGIEASRGEFIVMADSDMSYELSEIRPFVDALLEGYQLVIGTRIRGRIMNGAMPFLHRYVGNPFLTALANLFFGTRLSDYHCGMRAFRRDAIRALDLRTIGMEFASEMLIRAAQAGLRIHEVPITYHPAGRNRPPHLRTWRDGWRHLRFLLLYSPRWLLLYPGVVMTALGGVVSGILMAGPLRFGSVTFDVHSLLFSAALFVMGVQLVLLALLARAYASRAGLMPESPRLERFLEGFSLGLGLTAGLLVLGFGIALYGVGLYVWGENSFGPIFFYQSTLRLAIAGTTLIILGGEVFFGSFVLSLLSLQYSDKQASSGNLARSRAP